MKLFQMKTSETEAKKLSAELRQDSGGFLNRRRGVVALSLTAAGSMGIIALYQMGILKHVPEPDLAGLDADKVDSSAEAYARLRTPDAVLGFGSYAATMLLASMGGSDRARTQPVIPITLAAKVGFDAVQAGKLTVDQWTKHKSFCIWCLVAAGATFAMVPLVVPEATAAAKRLVRMA